MDDRLKRRIVDTVCEEWERTEGDLDSMVVYDRLIGEGESFPFSENGRAHVRVGGQRPDKRHGPSGGCAHHGYRPRPVQLERQATDQTAGGEQCKGAKASHEDTPARSVVG